MNQQMYQLMTLNCNLSKEKIIALLMENFKLTETTAKTYYYKWKKDFMKMKTDTPNPKLADRKPIVNEKLEKEAEDTENSKAPEPIKEEPVEEIKPIETNTKPVINPIEIKVTQEIAQEEIINALEVIKNVCRESDCCEDCPFGNVGEDCMITGGVPEQWNIKNPPLLRYLT